MPDDAIDASLFHRRPLVIVFHRPIPQVVTRAAPTVVAEDFELACLLKVSERPGDTATSEACATAYLGGRQAVRISLLQ